jgi:hypothetical protein
VAAEAMRQASALEVRAYLSDYMHNRFPELFATMVNGDNGHVHHGESDE